MLNNYVVSKFLNDDDIKQIEKTIKSSEAWKLNEVNIGDDTSQLLLRQSYFTDEQLLINIHGQLIDKSRNNLLFYDYCVPSKSRNTYISKMKVGDFQRIYNESQLVEDYKTVVFLNEPNEYEGGELVLFVNNQEVSFKLPKGFAVTYKTGVLCKINEVTAGERLTAVFSTDSMFKDLNIREIFSKLTYLSSILEAKPYVENFEEATQDPQYILNEIQDLVLYNYGDSFRVTN